MELPDWNPGHKRCNGAITHHYHYHRRRIETEAKAKVVAAVWGAEFISFLAALAVLPRSIWKKRSNSSFSWLIKSRFFPRLEYACHNIIRVIQSKKTDPTVGSFLCFLSHLIFSKSIGDLLSQFCKVRFWL